MRHLTIICVLLLLACAGCEPIVIDCGDGPTGPVNATCPPDRGSCPYKTVPPVDLPRELRASNYGTGSCMHAAFQDVLCWQNNERLAAYWRSNYAGGAGVGDVAAICDRLGVEFAYTTTGDVGFLEWCSRTRRGAAIYWSGGDHAITFCGFVGDQAVVVDNNDPGRVRWMPRAKFIEQWQASKGRAVTAVYAPTPPKPWV